MFGLITKKRHDKIVIVKLNNLADIYEEETSFLNEEIERLNQEIELDNYLLDKKNDYIEELEQPRVDLEYEELLSLVASAVSDL